MVSFDTVNYAISGRKTPEAELSTYLEEIARDAGFDTHRIAVPNQCADLLILFEREASLPWILFDSHLDTVSVEGMSVDPFTAKIDDGKLFGRGACDTKGSGAAMFSALATYADSCRAVSGVSETAAGGYNVMLMYSVDEEQGMSGIREFVNSYLPVFDKPLAGAIVGEPTRLEAVTAHNGVQRYRIATRGVAAHSADPSNGRSAISDMAKLIVFLEDEYIPALSSEYEKTGKAQCSINVIRGGSAANIIPDRCEIVVDRRTVPGESTGEIVGQVRELLREYAKVNEGVEIEFEAAIETPPLTPKPDHDFIEAICATIRSTGRCGKPVGVRYATHAGDLCVAGVPSVVLGPGDIDQGHTKDEWIDISELEAAVPLYEKIMRRDAGVWR